MVLKILDNLAFIFVVFIENEDVLSTLSEPSFDVYVQFEWNIKMLLQRKRYFT